MLKNKNQILLILLVVMLLSIIPVSAHAETPNDIKINELELQIEQLKQSEAPSTDLDLKIESLKSERNALAKAVDESRYDLAFLEDINLKKFSKVLKSIGLILVILILVASVIIAVETRDMEVIIFIGWMLLLTSLFCFLVFSHNSTDIETRIETRIQNQLTTKQEYERLNKEISTLNKSLTIEDAQEREVFLLESDILHLKEELNYFTDRKYKALK